MVIYLKNYDFVQVLIYQFDVFAYQQYVPNSNKSNLYQIVTQIFFVQQGQIGGLKFGCWC